MDCLLSSESTMLKQCSRSSSRELCRISHKRLSGKATKPSSQLLRDPRTVVLAGTNPTALFPAPFPLALGLSLPAGPYSALSSSVAASMSAVPKSENLPVPGFCAFRGPQSPALSQTKPTPAVHKDLELCFSTLGDGSCGFSQPAHQRCGVQAVKLPFPCLQEQS